MQSLPSSTKDPPLTFSRPRSQTDDETATVSAISTDLSRFMANVPKIDIGDQSNFPNIDNSDTDDDTTTIAESIFVVSSQCDNNFLGQKIDSIPKIDSTDQPQNPQQRKLIRSASFTVDTPCFQFPTDQGSKKFFNDQNDREFLSDQIKRLDDMRLSLEKYHRLQLDDLKIKQKRELETVEMQKSFLLSILNKETKNQKSIIVTDQKSEKVEPKKRPNSEYFRSHSANPKGAMTYRPLVRSPPPARQSIVIGDQNLKKSIPGENEEAIEKPIKSVSVPQKNLKVPEILKIKLAGMVKGYLIRRWFKTDRLKNMINTVKDLQNQLIDLEKEQSLASVDEHFKRMLAFQLQTSKSDFHDYIQSQSLSDRLITIAEHRYTQRNHLRRSRISTDNESPHPFGLLSSATVKSLHRKTTSTQSRLLIPSLSVCPTPNLSLAPPRRKNLFRLSPRSKSTLITSNNSPRKRKRFNATPSFCLMRSPRRLSSPAQRRLSPYHQKSKSDHNRLDTDDELSLSSSTTMNIRMTMNTVTRNPTDQSRWSGFCHLSDKDDKDIHISNRRPWR